eukprot:CAMPEP_0172593332 /NCGR_PEP_ID=MMETSP1068-20121228/12523_1 /TAXON_ID=35684 /ORGANISM="Pseudopedinella elastica, Strain CCMP716" /LENGTH=187 /DNA_ID=CAMNT_0013390797 /DNA_START=78 /DNA_END=638 /DNA_ORIENTATION=+
MPGKGLWKAEEMPTPKQYGPRIRPVENWSIMFDPAKPSTWRTGSARSAMAATEANDDVELKRVLSLVPYVKFVLDFAEQLDAACRSKSWRTAAVLLPWCEVDAWRASLLIATQMQDCKTLKHLLVDTAEWREHDRFRVELTGDEVHPSAKRSLELAVQVYKKVTPFRERGEGNEELLNAPFLKDGPW